MMRFAEKSFEIRFCAALSAAAMPFNRNPLWYGMTQAQERINGIDTMLSIGGHLLIFQFKAKSNSKFHLEREQLSNLTRIEARFPGSTHYVFPEANDMAAAAAAKCLLEKSWCCAPSKIGKTFKANAITTTLSLDPVQSHLAKARPKTFIPARTACETFGCFCPPAKARTFGHGGQTYWLVPGPDPDAFHRGQFFIDPDGTVSGIPIGDADGIAADRPSIRSVNDFEELLGERAWSNLERGLFGFFMPRT
jgi:hypothetical protein